MVANASGSISAMARAARARGWRSTPVTEARRARSAGTGRPAGASAVQTTPSAATRATIRNAGADPTQAASAPTPGPAIDPADSIPITIPDSRPRRSGGALWVTHAIDAVHTVPLATPCTNRAATSTPALGATANATVATVIGSAETSAMVRPPSLGTSGMLASDTRGTAAG